MKRTMNVCFLIVLLASPAAQAGTKEEIMRLQSDVLTLQNQMREFEKTLNESTEALRSLVIQLNDQVAKSGVILNRIASGMETQSSGSSSAQQALIQEIRGLSGKIDDSATRISALAQQIADLKVQSKPLPQPSTPDTVYNQAYSDLVQGNFDLAVQGFTAYLSTNPSGANAAAAQYNIGEAYYNQNKLPQAISAFTRVVNDYPGSERMASALFKRAKAELAMQESENAIADFKSVLERFPAATEASLAKDELQKLGLGGSKPAETRRKR